MRMFSKVKYKQKKTGIFLKSTSPHTASRLWLMAKNSCLHAAYDMLAFMK